MPPVSCPWASNPKVGVCSLPPLQVLVIRLRDSLIKMGEELSQAATAEAQQRESSQYYQRRLEELKADMQELVEREAEASRRCMELVSGSAPVLLSGGFEIRERPESGASGPGRKPEGDGQRDYAALGCQFWGAGGRPQVDQWWSLLDDL